jgi:hypothetical protein
VNIVQAALEKLRAARVTRARFDKQVADGVKRVETNIQLILDKVAQELPLKDRDTCVLLTDSEYAEYARKHFGLQISVAATIMLNLQKTESDEEPDWDETPSEDF